MAGRTYTGKNKFKWDRGSGSVISIGPKDHGPKLVTPPPNKYYKVDKHGNVSFHKSKYYSKGGHVWKGRPD